MGYMGRLIMVLGKSICYLLKRGLYTAETVRIEVVDSGVYGSMSSRLTQ